MPQKALISILSQRRQRIARSSPLDVRLIVHRLPLVSLPSLSLDLESGSCGSLFFPREPTVPVVYPLPLALPKVGFVEMIANSALFSDLFAKFAQLAVQRLFPA